MCSVQSGTIIKEYDMVKCLKILIEKIPFGIGRWLARVPFSWRLGKVYVRMKEECARSLEWPEAERYSVENFRAISSMRGSSSRVIGSCM